MQRGSLLNRVEPAMRANEEPQWAINKSRDPNMAVLVDEL